MRILTWNLCHGGGARRMPAITLALLEHRADVMVLTEFRSTIGGQIAGILADHGLVHQQTTELPRGCNGILVASRSPLDVAPAVPVAAGPGRPASTGRRLTRVHFPEAGFSLVGLHVPPDGRGSGREAVFQDAVGIAEESRDRECILIGDFNAGRHRLDEAGTTFTCTRLLGRLAAFGYVDAWRSLHPDGREYTWFSHEGQGFRIDHAFISRPLSACLTACRYSHLERESGLSDHSVLTVDLDVGA